LKKSICTQTCLLLFLGTAFFLNGQNIHHNGGLLLTSQITLGNQNDWFKLGLFGFGAVNYRGIAIEGGVSLGLKQLFKRHTLSVRGRSYSYEFFGMLGGGQNQDLLGATTSTQNNTLFSTPLQNSSFLGIGFGYEKEILPNELKTYTLRRGKLLLRYSNNNANLHLAFLNDFKAGKLFYGEGTDYGETGTFSMGFTKKNNAKEAYEIGYGITLFTPPANYSRSPRNLKNSDNGRKNVWFTQGSAPQLFYANAFAYGNYQKESYSFHSKLGVESNKMGASIQNKLHDGFGLNPRYPWDTKKKNAVYYELEATLFYNTTAND
tara:strand:- start:16791 stop:17750 length:960 start_codon:yes stop_codon:yes gene_type:complete